MKIGRQIIGILLLGVAIVLGLWWIALDRRPVSVRVPRGASAREIGDVLYRAGVVSSPRVFGALARLSTAASHFKPGRYEFSRRDSMISVMRELVRGSRLRARVVIPEGFTIDQTAAALKNAGVEAGRDFAGRARAADAEGFLFPATYEFDHEASADQVIAAMREEFTRRLEPMIKAGAPGLGLGLRDVVVLASVVERETGDPLERPRVAGVFLNRLRKHWPLESCATVLYALGGHRGRLTLEDLNVVSPYNTYRHAGLPPGPICSPGEAAVRAVLGPAGTGELFFVADGQGHHRFASSYKQHLANKRQLLRSREP